MHADTIYTEKAIFLASKFGFNFLVDLISNLLFNPLLTALEHNISDFYER